MQANGKSQSFLLTFVFALVCVLSAVSLIYTKHESRKLFVELEALTHERDELNIEWGQLQIEQSTWAQHARIEKVATEDQSLMRPETADVIVIERPRSAARKPNRRRRVDSSFECRWSRLFSASWRYR